MNRSDRPCTFDSAKCSVKMKAAFVEGTNLVMVWIIQDKTSDNCYDETQCPKVEPSEVPFGFEKVPPLDPSEKCTGVPHRKPSRSRSMCYNSVHEVRESAQVISKGFYDGIECEQMFASGMVLFHNKEHEKLNRAPTPSGKHSAAIEKVCISWDICWNSAKLMGSL
ncbi:hypothetical protein OSTOST_01922 [Ostertagia ostertagi]